MIGDVEFQSGLAAHVVRLFAAYQLVLPARHGEKAGIGARDYAVEKRRLHVRFQHDFFLARKIAVRGGRQRAQPRQPVLGGGKLAVFFRGSVKSAAVRLQAGVHVLLPGGQRLLIRGKRAALCAKGRDVGHAALRLFFQ